MNRLLVPLVGLLTTLTACAQGTFSARGTYPWAVGAVKRAAGTMQLNRTIEADGRVGWAQQASKAFL